MPLLNVYRRIQPMRAVRRWRECELWVNDGKTNECSDPEALGVRR
jgi:hypothetical protein